MIITICFIALLIDRYCDRLLPLLRQFLLIPHRNTKFFESHSELSYPLLSIILLVFDQYVVIAIF